MMRAGPGEIQARPFGVSMTNWLRCSILLRLGQRDEAPGAAGRLDIKSQLVGLAGKRLEVLDRAERLDLAVLDDPRDELTGLDPGGLGRAPLLDAADEQALGIFGMSKLGGQLGR